jgi:comEA protein
MKNILHKTGLNRKELIIIGFLTITFTAGLLLKYSGWKNPEEYNYTESDRSFEKNAGESFDKLYSNTQKPEEKTRAEQIRKFADSLYSYADNKIENEVKLSAGRKININTALAADIALLPGIGSVIAERIIEYRDTHGSFKSIEELKKVKGIGEKKFLKIKEQIFIE